MWIYVPNNSTSSQSAPAEGGSIWASSWQFQALAQSVWWRGKPSQSRHWYQRCKKVSWLKLLFGAMPEPSTAALGVAQWTASLVASRASLTVSQESASVKKTSAISGPMHGVSSSSQELGSSSSRTSAACSRRAVRNASGETFSDWASRLREDCSRRQKSARAMSGSGSLSSQWRTPTDDSRRGGPQSAEKRAEGGHTVNLQDQVLDWQASAWPTPTANDWKGSGPTLERKDGQMRGDRLDYATEQLWATPTSLNFDGSHQPGNSRSYNINMDLAQNLYSRLAQVTVKTGTPYSKERRSLNPLFVEWLMGWPPGWTLLVSTDFGCSATELSAWKRRMRSALLRLGLPREAPPAQLALFG